MNFTNSALVTYTNLTKNRTENRSHVIDTITIHCAVGQCTAKEGCDYFARTSRQVSSNYYVGYDGSIGLSVEEKDRAWTSNGKDKLGNIIKVNGVSGADNDHRAVTVEVASDAKAPYSITDAAYTALISLVTDICRRNNIKELKWKATKSLVGKVEEQNMTVHRWFANTSCPGSYLYQRLGDIAHEVNLRLNSSEEEPIKYYIQIGMYSNIYEAETRLKQVKAAGFSDAALIKVNNRHSDEQVEPAVKIKVGSIVKLNKGAKTYTGGNIASFVYDREHEVREIAVDRAVITYRGAVVAAVCLADLTLIR